MRLKDLKIRTQLAIELAVILSFVLFLGIVAFYQGARLWQNTASLYEHPLTVRRAIGEIKADIISVNLHMKNIILSDNEQDTEKEIQIINTFETDAYKKFDIIYESYLGSKSDIDTAYNDFVSWKAVREETVRLYRLGNINEAAARTKDSGAAGSLFNKLIESINIISAFAENKGDEFYYSALDLHDDLKLQLSLITVIIVILTTIVIYFLYRSISNPLKVLNNATDRFWQGDHKARSTYRSSNEYGKLSESFNSLAETIENEITLSNDTAAISNSMLEEEDLECFRRELLKELIKKTDSQIGAFYFLDEDKKQFILYDSIGLNEKARRSFSANENEGELGLAVASKQIQHIKEIPKDTFLSFSAAAADFLPKEIITIPVLSDKEVIAVISLASIKNYSDLALKLLNEIRLILNARTNGMLVSYKIHELAKKLEYQNIELEQQSKELTMQKDELSEQNIELELQKNQLGESSRLKSTFLSNMSHELRTPLNSIIALSGVLNRRLLSKIPDEDYSYIEVIERSGQLLLALINDLLDLSRIEAGKEEINISSFNIKDLINLVYETVEPQTRKKNINFSKSIEKSIPLILSDFNKCRSILQNLVSNAVKFTETGNVEIYAYFKEDLIYIKVEDTGIGIEKDKLSVIFDEFRQADDSSSRKYEGTGLGLSIAKKYAKMLQGDIEVESTPGKGSIFTFKLPVEISLQSESSSGYFQNEKIKNNTSEGSSISAEYKDKTILIVEDSEPAIIQISDILESQGIKILAARNGKEALEKIEISIPDALILDLMMPEVDGFEVLNSIRSREKTSQIPVLILTAKHVTKEELNLLKGNYIYQLIQKGDINKKEFLNAIKNLLLENKPLAKSEPAANLKKLKRSEKAKILIVEDNPDNMKTLKALLKEEYIIFEAIDGKSGLEQAKLYIPDLILLDISLPVMDGFQALDAIRKEEKLKNIPVIAITANAMKGSREEILSYGFDSYISKPVEEKILLETIEEVIFGNL